MFPDGRRVVSAGGMDKTLKVWEIKETEKKVQMFEVNVPQARYSVYAVS